MMSDSHWSDDDFYEAFPLPANDDPSFDNDKASLTPESESNIAQEPFKPPEKNNSGQEEMQSSDTDDIPLAHLANKPKKRKSQSPSSSSEFDDTDKDETYSPSISSATSPLESESELPVIININKRKWWRKRNRPLRIIAQKSEINRTKTGKQLADKRKTNCRKEREQTSRRITKVTNKSDSDISKAQKESLLMYNINQIRKKAHIRRLNHLLTSNNFTQIQSEPDGDCFFNAVRCQITTEDYTASNLRAYVCDHLLHNENNYIEFLHFTDDLSTEQKSQAYAEKVKVIETAGIWNQDIADIVPMAVANLFNAQITIFSSRVNNPIINIEPTMGMPTDVQRQPFMLSYLAMRGFEHYDCIIKSPATTVSSSLFTSNGSQNNQHAYSHRSPTVTPRKKADYISPTKKRTSRKKTANPSKWKKNIRKENKSMGKSYISPGNKKTIPAKCLKPMDCSTCRYKCTTKVTQETRQKLFDHYYSPQMTYERKRDFICRHIEVKPTSKRNLRTYKLNSRTYMLPVDGRLVRVCKQFFLKTLDISDKLVRCTLSKKEHCSFKSVDRRGKHVPANKTESLRIAYVKHHIQSFPTVDSHYQRKNTQRKFLEPGLSISRMYDLYKDKCKSENVIPVSSKVYRTIFCTEYNLSFHKPKKDTCAFCNTYKEKERTGFVSDMEKYNYDEHLRRKEEARREKENDKEASKKDKSIYSATFDLQAVLYTPCSNVSKVFYKRKLNCYNFTVFSLADKCGACYIWDETNGQRGSSEIGSCLITHLKSLPSTVKHVILYSDCCSGQNRNQYLAAGLHHTVKTSPSLQILEQKFLESGHTQMECDSMHAAIEHAKKGLPFITLINGTL